jgi:hypothetical protein
LSAGERACAHKDIMAVTLRPRRYAVSLRHNGGVFAVS